MTNTTNTTKKTNGKIKRTFTAILAAVKNKRKNKENLHSNTCGCNDDVHCGNIRCIGS